MIFKAAWKCNEISQSFTVSFQAQFWFPGRRDINMGRKLICNPNLLINKENSFQRADKTRWPFSSLFVNAILLMTHSFVTSVAGFWPWRSSILRPRSVRLTLRQWLESQQSLLCLVVWNNRICYEIVTMNTLLKGPVFNFLEVINDVYFRNEVI